MKCMMCEYFRKRKDKKRKQDEPEENKSGQRGTVFWTTPSI